MKVMSLRSLLDVSQRTELQKLMGVDELFNFRYDPVDATHHRSSCRVVLNPAEDLVVLPKDQPIPLLAMQDGYRHVAFTPGGIKLLVAMDVTFVDFEPSRTMAEATSEYQQQLAERLGALRLAVDIMAGFAPVDPDNSQRELDELRGLIRELDRRLNPIRVIKPGVPSKDRAKLATDAEHDF